MGGLAAEREACIEAARRHGWWIARYTKRGYTVMRCACGEHQETLHKTPSNPNHYKVKLAKMARDCSRPDLGR